MGGVVGGIVLTMLIGFIILVVFLVFQRNKKVRGGMEFPHRQLKPFSNDWNQ